VTARTTDGTSVSPPSGAVRVVVIASPGVETRPVSDDLVAPEITSPAGDIETAPGSAARLRIEGTAPSDAQVAVYDGNTLLGTVTADADGRWQFELLQPLSEEEHVVTARTTDGTSVSPPSGAVRIVVTGAQPTPAPSPTPTTAPATVEMPVSDKLAVPAITNPAGDIETTDAQVRIEGTAPPNARVVIYDGNMPLDTVTADEDGRWQYESSLSPSEAEHVVTVRTTDGTSVSLPSGAVRVVVAGTILPITGAEQPDGTEP
jgi:hypothetical protein